MKNTNTLMYSLKKSNFKFFLKKNNVINRDYQGKEIDVKTKMSKGVTFTKNVFLFFSFIFVIRKVFHLIVSLYKMLYIT